MVRSPTSSLTLAAPSRESGRAAAGGNRPKRAAHGSFVAALIARHEGALRRHLRGLLGSTEAEDVFQETCRRLLETGYERGTGDVYALEREMASAIALALAHATRPAIAASR